MQRKNIVKKLGTFHETQLQEIVHKTISLVDKHYISVKGHYIQVLSCGRINHHEGPDFINMAIMINGIIHIGNGEFHRKNSDWIKHKHHLDPRYNNLILHIVQSYDIESDFAKETVIIDEVLHENVHNDQYIDHSFDIEDLQVYAFQRLLRKTSEIKVLSTTIASKSEVLYASIILLMSKLQKRKRRPHHNSFSKDYTVYHLVHHESIQYLIHNHNYSLEQLRKVCSLSFEKIGHHLYTEIIVNCILPLLMSNAHDCDKNIILDWYWSAKSVIEYAYLSRLNSSIKQDMIWKQQGLLEYYHKEYNRGIICKEALILYSINTINQFLII
jgi:hypothetical protein